MKDCPIHSSKKFNREAKEEIVRSKRTTTKVEKTEKGEKVVERRNYIYYVSGVGYVKSQEEANDILRKRFEEKKRVKVERKPERKPEPQPRIEEQGEALDNYQYQESKNIRKMNPKRESITIHHRLSKVEDEPILHTSASQPRIMKRGGENPFCPVHSSLRATRKSQRREEDEELDKEVKTRQEGEYLIRVTTTRKEIEKDAPDEEPADNYNYRESKMVGERKRRSKARESVTVHYRRSLRFSGDEGENEEDICPLHGRRSAH